MKMTKVKKIILSALLLATSIILSRSFLAINTPIVTISFSFIPIMLGAVILGPKWSTLIAGFSDLIGANVFPFGTFFIGYTISALFRGLIYGMIIFKKEGMKDKEFVIRLTIATFVVSIFINLLLTSLWVYMTSGEAVNIIAKVRITREALMIPLQISSIFFLEKTLKPYIKKYLYDEE